MRWNSSKRMTARDTLERRRAAAVRAQFERMDAEWFEHPADETRQRYARELHNLRAAGDWARGAAHDAETVVALAADSTEIWLSTGLIHEGLQCWQRARPFLSQAAPAVQLRYWLAGTAYYRWWSDGREAGDRAIGLARELRDHRRLYIALSFAASHAAHRGEQTAASAALDELDSIERADWPPALRIYGLEAARTNRLMQWSRRGNTRIAQRMARDLLARRQLARRIHDAHVHRERHVHAGSLSRSRATRPRTAGPATRESL